MIFVSLIKKAALTSTILLASAAAALAVDATAKVELNVRTGPGVSFGVLDTLETGELVHIQECQESGWCYIKHPGPDGWVSSSFLEAVPDPSPTPGTGTNCRLQLTLGTGTPIMQIICDPVTPPPPPPPPPPVGDEVCLYVHPNFNGESFCYATGKLNSLNTTFNDRIASIQLLGAGKVRVCTDQNLTGSCTNIESNVNNLGPVYKNRISSLQVYTGIAPGTFVPIPIPIPLPVPLTPTTHKTGQIVIPSSFSANLDNGVVGGSGADLWHHALGGGDRRLEPRNGAGMNVGSGSNRGFAGCNAVGFSADPVPFSDLPVGTYVCVKTSEGRISQFRVNAYTGTAMRIGFTTWAN